MRRRSFSYLEVSVFLRCFRRGAVTGRFGYWCLSPPPVLSLFLVCPPLVSHFFRRLFLVQDLLDTLQTAAEIELSLTADAPPTATVAAAAATVPDARRTDPPQQRRALPHQKQYQKQQQHQPSVVGAGGGRGGLNLGSDSGISGDGGGREQASAGDSSNVVSGDGDGGRDGEATGESIRSRPTAEVKTTAAAAAVGARAQELMKARFAGMKSAAEAKSAAAAAAAATDAGGSVEGSKSTSSAASSFGKGIQPVCCGRFFGIPSATVVVGLLSAPH